MDLSSDEEALEEEDKSSVNAFTKRLSKYRKRSPAKSLSRGGYSAFTLTFSGTNHILSQVERILMMTMTTSSSPTPRRRKRMLPCLHPPDPTRVYQIIRPILDLRLVFLPMHFPPKQKAMICRERRNL